MIQYDWSQTSQAITIVVRGLAKRPEVFPSPLFIRITDFCDRRVLCVDLLHEIQFKTLSMRFSDRILTIQVFKAIRQRWPSLEPSNLSRTELSKRRECSITSAEIFKAETIKESKTKRDAMVLNVSNLLLQQVQNKSAEAAENKSILQLRADDYVFNHGDVEICEDTFRDCPTEQPLAAERVKISGEIAHKLSQAHGSSDGESSNPH